MFEQLQGIEERFESLTHRLSNPEVASDGKLFRELSKEHSDLSPLVDAYRRYKAVQVEMDDCRELLGESDPDMVALAREDLKTLTAEKEAVG